MDLFRTLAAVTLIAVSGAAMAARTSVYHNVDLNPGGTLELVNFSGNIEIEGWKKDYVKVKARLRADSIKALKSIKVLKRGGADHALILTQLPALAADRKDDPEAEVTYTISVPKSVGRIVVQTVNGDVKVRDSAGDLEIETVNGDITVGEIQGRFSIKTVNGGITAIAERFSGPVDVSTNNGGVTVVLPRSAAFDVLVRTLTGEVKVRFPLSQTVSSGLRRVEGQVNGGGPKVRLESLNGSVNLAAD